MNKQLLVILLLICSSLSMFIPTPTAITVPIVATNDATGVKETNATLQGMLTDSGTGEGNVTDYYTSWSGLLRWGSSSNAIKMVDGSLSTFAFAQGTGDIQRVNTVFDEDDRNYGNITTISIRAYGYYTQAAARNDIVLVPVTWNGTIKYGNDHSWTPNPTTPAWGNWIDITNDTNMPGWNNWTWTIIEGSHPVYPYGLQVNVTTNSSAGTKYYVAMVQIRINTTNSSTWFQYGTTTSYGTNTTAQVNETGDTFSADATGLSPGTLYHYCSVARNANTTNFGSDKTFLTKPDPPSSLSVLDHTNTTITISGSKNASANRTIVMRRHTAPPSSVNDPLATEVYNNTDVNFQFIDTGLNPAGSNPYWYRAWSYRNISGLEQYSDTYSQIAQNTTPSPPCNVVADMIANGTKMDINITWSVGNGASMTYIRKKAGSPPTSHTDGIVVGNVSVSVSQYVNDTGITQPFYYRLWSFTAGKNEVSYTYTDATWYVAWVECYDENTTLPISNFGVFFTNENGTQTYMNNSCTNPHVISMSSLPQGKNVALQVNATEYDTRLYYLNIEELTGNEIYYITCYLLPSNLSKLYLLQIIDELDQPVSDATVNIKRYINETVGYQNVTILHTDTNGQVNTYLQVGKLHKVIITKTGYETEISDYVPSDSIFTHTFKLEFSEPTEPTTYVFWDVVSFTGISYSNGSVKVTYVDSSSQTTNTQFYMYSHYNTTDTLVDTTTKTGENTTTYWVTDLNLSRLHYVNLYFNHSYNFEEVQPIKIIILPINDTTNRTQASFESYFVATLGENPLGWGNSIAFVVAIVLLCSFSPFQVGIGIISAGAGLVAVQAMFVFSNIYILVIIPIVIFIGIFYILTTREPGGHL